MSSSPICGCPAFPAWNWSANCTQRQPRLPIILTTAFGTTETAIEATKFGAYDYLLKPFDIPRLLDLVQKAADSNRLMSEPVSLGEAGAPNDALVGQSAADAGHLQGNRPRRLQADQRSYPRRNRHRQGIDRARHLSAQRPRQRAVHRRQLRRHSGNAAGKRTLRPRKRRVHRRASPAHRPLRAGPSGHDFSG